MKAPNESWLGVWPVVRERLHPLACWVFGHDWQPWYDHDGSLKPSPYIHRPAYWTCKRCEVRRENWRRSDIRDDDALYDDLEEVEVS